MEWDMYYIVRDDKIESYFISKGVDKEISQTNVLNIRGDVDTLELMDRDDFFEYINARVSPSSSSPVAFITADGVKCLAYHDFFVSSSREVDVIKCPPALWNMCYNGEPFEKVFERLFFDRMIISMATIATYTGTTVYKNGGYTDSTRTFTATTVDSSPFTIQSIIMPSSLQESYVIEVRLLGYIVAGNDVFISYTIMANNDHGSITSYSGTGPSEAPMLLIRDGTATLDSCYIASSISGNTLNINVNGMPATIVNWTGTIRIHRAVH